jgi:hypothetical protein
MHLVNHLCGDLDLRVFFIKLVQHLLLVVDRFRRGFFFLFVFLA